jgi:hypothetical protein
MAEAGADVVALDASRRGLDDLAAFLASLKDARRTPQLRALQRLDLSRNAVQSLAGLDGLPSLRSLNLYYNRVACLDEVWWLHRLPALESLDLRLNPATQTPGYRR